MEVSASIAADEASDYGSDFAPDEEEILNGLLQAQPVLETDNPIVTPELHLRDAEGHREGLLCLRVPNTAHNRLLQPQILRHIQVTSHAKHPDEVHNSHTELESYTSIDAPLSPPAERPDLRSPIERFRSKPRKPLSVTDLISPSWCELQYWYVLTKHGKKRRTLAMRQGSKLHQNLEDQVHVTVPVETKTKENIGDLRGVKVPKVLEQRLPKKLEDEVLVTVPIEIKTKEDNWGLRLWNMIQGLQTLRETGMTRELEVWGLLDGHLVNGVIDELSYVCPDPELEATIEERSKNASRKPASPAPDQATITEFFNTRKPLESNERSFNEALLFPASKSPTIAPSSFVYVSDVKTRRVSTLPRGASFKPTVIQLHLYHRMLGELADGKFDANVLFDRHDLNKSLHFSDSLVAQIGGLKQNDWSGELDEGSSSIPNDLRKASQDSLNTLLSHNSLGSLWSRMMEEFKTTFPKGAKSLGQVLKAEYRDIFSGDLMGIKTILYDHHTLQEYLDDEMSWWRGARSAKGVPIEEAFKCGSCEFAEGCEWRINKIDDHVKTMRSRSQV